MEKKSYNLHLKINFKSKVTWTKYKFEIKTKGYKGEYKFEKLILKLTNYKEGYCKKLV